MYNIIEIELKLVLLTTRQPISQMTRYWGKEKQFYSDSQQAENMADWHPKEPS